jgi:hypothetical protein
MSTEIVKDGGGSRSLSEDLVAGLIAGIDESRASTPIIGGTPILRLSKAGKWIFGQTDDLVQEGSTWAVNPLSIQHGFVCWSDYPGSQKNELLGSAMVRISEKKPIMPDPIKGFPFKEQRIFELKCIDGEDEGMQVVYKGSSIGAMKACDTFFALLRHQLKFVDSHHSVALIQLLSKPYIHGKFGETFNPIFEIVGWADMDGNIKGAATAEPGEEPAPQPTPQPAPQPAPQPTPQPAPQPAKPPLSAKPPLTQTETPARPGAGAPRRQRPVGA